MAQHKWHKEIKAWADGAEIECKPEFSEEWRLDEIPRWYPLGVDYRIKPKVKITGRVASNTWLEEHEVRIEALEKIVSSQPKDKKPQYLYVYADSADPSDVRIGIKDAGASWENCIGKIKLEDEDV